MSYQELWKLSYWADDLSQQDKQAEMGRLTAEPGVYYPDEVRDQLRTSRSLDRGVQPCGAVHVGGRADDGFWEGFGVFERPRGLRVEPRLLLDA